MRRTVAPTPLPPHPMPRSRSRVPSDRLYDSQYRRRRSSPVAAIVGLLVVALVTGGVILAGGTYVGQALTAIAAPETSPSPSDTPGSDPVAGAVATEVPVRTTPTRRPRATTAPSSRPAAEATGAVAEGVAGVEADPTAAPAPERTPHPWSDLRPRPRRGAFTMDVDKAGAFASEATPEWCVPAAMLTMINIVKKRSPIDSVPEQQRLYNLARRHSTDKLTGAGAEPEGWAEGLNREGIGPYIVHVAVSRRFALREAARAIRLTGRPVGILAWRGAHSMVMTGFRATGDPAFTDDFEVTHVVMTDVWYPRFSSIWGESLPPGSRETVERLAQDFLPWRRPDVTYPNKDGKYIVILPVRDDGRYDPRRGA